MNTKILVFGAILLVMGVLMTIGSSAMYNHAYERYNYWYDLYFDSLDLKDILAGEPYPENALSNMSDMYKDVMSFYETIFNISILIIIVSFIMMLYGVFTENKDKQKTEIKKSNDRFCPSCGRIIPFDANVCPYCGKKFEEM